MVAEDRWSDHRPKEMRCRLKFRKLKQFATNRTERIDWRKLRKEENVIKYQELLEAEDLPEEMTWSELAGKMKKAALEVCGKEDNRSKTSQWMEGRESEAKEFKSNIQSLAKRKRETETEYERKEAGESLRKVRKEYKSKLREWETA